MTLTAYEQWVANSVGALVNAADPMEMMRAVKNAPAETRYMTLLSFARVAPATAPASSANVGGAGAGEHCAPPRTSTARIVQPSIPPSTPARLDPALHAPICHLKALCNRTPTPH